MARYIFMAYLLYPVTQLLRTLCFGFLLVLLALPAAAQTQGNRTATEQRLHELREQIRLDEQRLSLAAQAEQASLHDLRSLDRQIALRRELTDQLQQRLLELSAQSDSLLVSTDVLAADIDGLKEQYQRRAVHAYKHGRLHDIALILAAESINQMLIRIRYLTRFANERRDKLRGIQAAADTLAQRQQALAEAREEAELLLLQAEQEQQQLSNLQRSRQQVVQQLQTERTTIQHDLTQKRQAASEFEARLRNLITAETTRRRNTTDTRELREFRELSGSFLSNQGRLPWPARGVVVEPFGEVINPVYGTSTPNPGVFIATNPQDEVRAVFDGTILSVSVIPEFGRYILIEHGEYQTAYSNFSLIYVGEGERIKAGQTLGRAGTEDEPKGAGVFFALFQSGEAIDPVPWLGRR